MTSRSPGQLGGSSTSRSRVRRRRVDGLEAEMFELVEDLSTLSAELRAVTKEQVIARL